MTDPGALQMKYLKELLLSKPYFERVPDQSLVQGNGERYDRILASRGNTYALLYTYTGRSFKVVMGKIKGAQSRAYWFNPKDGTTQALGTIANTGIKEFDPPGEQAAGNDWVLVLESE
jgi:collagenase-like protein with putative collagen-binding domain